VKTDISKPYFRQQFMRSQGRDIKRIVERLDSMDQRIEQLGTTLHEHTALLTQILERLPKQQS
jgi:hypothetical protein